MYVKNHDVEDLSAQQPEAARQLWSVQGHRAERPDSTDLLPAGSLGSWQERICVQDFTVANIKQSAKTQSKVAVSGGKRIW